MEQKYYENNSKIKGGFKLFLSIVFRLSVLLLALLHFLSLFYHQGLVFFIKTPVEYRFLIKKEDDSEDETGDELEDDTGEEFENESDLDCGDYSSGDNNVENDSNNEEDSFLDHFYFES